MSYLYRGVKWSIIPEPRTTNAWPLETIFIFLFTPVSFRQLGSSASVATQSFVIASTDLGFSFTNSLSPNRQYQLFDCFYRVKKSKKFFFLHFFDKKSPKSKKIENSTSNVLVALIIRNFY